MTRQVDEIRLLPPVRVPMTAEQHRRAVDLLAELIVDVAWKRRVASAGGSADASTGVTPAVTPTAEEGAVPHRSGRSGDSKNPTYKEVTSDRSKWWCATPSAAGDVQPARSAGEHPHRPRPRDRLLPLPAPGADDGPTRAPVLLVEADGAEASAFGCTSTGSSSASIRRSASGRASSRLTGSSGTLA